MRDGNLDTKGEVAGGAVAVDGTAKGLSPPGKGLNGFGRFRRAVTVPRQSEPCCKRKHSEVRGRALGTLEGLGLSCSRVVAHYAGEISKPSKARGETKDRMPQAGQRLAFRC